MQPSLYPEKLSSPPASSGEKVPAMEMLDVTIGSIRFPGRVMLEGVNWTVHVGDFWAIGGLQATGKSDLLFTATGLMRPQRGIYRVFGKELAAGYEHELLASRLRIGLVFDGGRLLQHLTIAENILLPLRYHQEMSPTEARERLRPYLELIGLTRHADAYPASVALNWQQRAGLARALALKPEVLLLDNPLTGLDPQHHAWWLALLDQLHAGHPILDNRPLTLVVTGDDVLPWQRHARQFGVLRDGRFVPVTNQPGTAPADDSGWRALMGL